MGSIQVFVDFILPGYSMALGSTHHLREMSTGEGEKKRPVCTADNFTTFICRLSKNCKPQTPGTLTACPGLYRDTFTFTYTFY